MESVRRVRSVEEAVGLIGDHAGVNWRVAAPLGLGKPNTLLNAMYRAAEQNTALRLHLYTALSLARPTPSSDIEKRFVGPFSERHFGPEYPDLAYVQARQRRQLPLNVRVSEFYLQSGSLLNNPQAQGDYASLNYTHVARDLADAGINVVVQMIARRRDAGRERFSLASNPDVTQDLIDAMTAAGHPRPLVVGVVHEDLPFIGNEAEVSADFFDVLWDDETPTHTLFALPREPIGLAEFALGLHASTLVRDGGTLQIGIGALSDAIVYGLLLRQDRNADYRAAIEALGGAHPLSTRIGGLDAFERGLYGASEMVMDGFMHLVRGGVLKRRVYDDFPLEQALAEDVIGDRLDSGAVERLYACGALPAHVDAREVTRLVRFGLLPFGTAYDAGSLVFPDGSRENADLSGAEARGALGRAMAGRTLRDGRYLRGAFYLGTKDFYAWLRGLSGDAFDGLSMTRVSDINQLYGGREALDALQRRDARFFNTCMMATALGAATSDALADGRVVSGVGGQYNFVSMAHALRDGRSILLLRSHRGDGAAATSNILWSYGHVTIPRHLRDVYVTEYGVADLRGKSDQECTLAMLAISDARFLDPLVADARRAGKLAADFQVPARWRENTPEHLAAALAPFTGRGLFPAWPFGSDFDEDELRLLAALQWLKARSATRWGRLGLLWRALWSEISDEQSGKSLTRMGLATPHTLNQRVSRRILVAALAATAPA